VLGLKLSHEGQDNFNILTICFKQKEGGISSHTLKSRRILMKGIFNVLICLLFPIAWGALINWIFTFLERRTGRSTPPNPRIDYHI
jgi:hypothetical protein